MIRLDLPDLSQFFHAASERAHQQFCCRQNTPNPILFQESIHGIKPGSYAGQKIKAGHILWVLN